MRRYKAEEEISAEESIQAIYDDIASILTEMPIGQIPGVEPIVLETVDVGDDYIEFSPEYDLTDEEVEEVQAYYEYMEETQAAKRIRKR